MNDKLDIRFQAEDNTTLNSEEKQKIIDTLYNKFGDLAKEINATNGYFIVKHQYGMVIGNPLHYNVTTEVGIKIMQAASRK